MGGGELAGLTTGTFVRSRPVRTSFADLNGRELDGLARKLPRRQTELNVLSRCILATDRKRKNLLFIVRQKSEKWLGKYYIITEKLSKNHQNIFRRNLQA